MVDCDGNFTDPWCFCYNSLNQSIPQYKQFDANNDSNSRGIGFHCCNILHNDPSFVAQQSPSQGTINTNVSYLTTLTNLTTNKICDYDEYLNQVDGDTEFKNKFPDLYLSTNANRIIFNAFFNKDNSVHQGVITANTQLIPTFSDNTVSCPVSTYIPYYIGYQTSQYSKTDYVYICYPQSAAFPALAINYKSVYFYDNNNNNCKNNSCTTTYALANGGINAGHTAHQHESSDNSNTLEIVLLSVAGVIFFIAIVLIIVYSLKIKEMNEKKK